MKETISSDVLELVQKDKSISIKKTLDELFECWVCSQYSNSKSKRTTVCFHHKILKKHISLLHEINK